MIAKFYRFMAMAMVAGSLLLPGCKDDDLNGSLSFSEDNLLLKAAGDTMVVAVTAGSDWKAESQADWCTVEKESAEKLIVRVAPSDDIYERGTAVKITCADNVFRLAVRQEPMVFEIADEKKSLDFEKYETINVLKIRTNMSWKVEIADTTGWLQVADTAGSGDTELVFTVSDNSQKAERATTVRLRYGVRSLKLTANQKGGLRADGHTRKHYGERELENGYNLIFLSEGFIKEELIAETGVFDQAVDEACEFLFNMEPYKTYKEYFNVYSVACVSKERGVALKDGASMNTAFSGIYDSNEVAYYVSREMAWYYALKVPGMTAGVLQKNTCVVVLVNDDRYGGNTYWLSDGRALSVVPLNRDTQLPGGFTNIFLHEVGGHGIGKLADEWSDDVPITAGIKQFLTDRINIDKYCWNIGLPHKKLAITKPTMVLTYQTYASAYTGIIGCYDGGFGFVSDSDAENNLLCIVHSEEKSCMIDHLPYFNVASRYCIVQQILTRIGEEFSSTIFKENDKYEIPEAQPVSDRPRLMKPIWIDLTEE